MDLMISTTFALMAAVPVLSSVELHRRLNVTIVTDYPDSDFSAPDAPVIEWSTYGSNTPILGFTRVYNLLLLTVDPEHTLEFDVRREEWGSEYKHHVSMFQSKEESAN
jgi:hypothetical protein